MAWRRAGLWLVGLGALCGPCKAFFHSYDYVQPGRAQSQRRVQVAPLRLRWTRGDSRDEQGGGKDDRANFPDRERRERGGSGNRTGSRRPGGPSSSERAYPKDNNWQPRKGPRRPESIGSTAWRSVEECAEDRGSLPAWKLPKSASEEEGEREWSKPARVPAAKRRRKLNASQLEAIKSGRTLDLDDLENKLKSKFSKVNFEKGEYYDTDDEGFELPGGTDGPVEEGGSPDTSAEIRRSADSDAALAADWKNARDETVPEPAKPSAPEPALNYRMRPKAALPEADLSKSQSAAESAGEKSKKQQDKESRQVAAPVGTVTVDNVVAGSSVDDGNVKVEYLEHVSIKKIPAAADWEETNFADLGVTLPAVVENMAAMGIDKPTSVQTQALRALLAEGNTDAIIHSYTGSGKTMAFLLPLLMRMDPSVDSIQAVVVSPGRELGSQTFGVCEKLAADTGLRIQMVLGGANVKRQVERVRKNKPHVLIGTPGRLCELALEMRAVRLGNVKFLVLDEVDALMRHPYDEEVGKIVKALRSPDFRQTVFASATGKSPRVVEAAKKFMKEDYVLCGSGSHEAQTVASLPSHIKHYSLTVPKVKKFETLRRLLHTHPFPESVMIFVNDPHQVKWLTEKLERVNIIAAPMSGDMEKEDRTDIMRRLQDGRLGMVVSTEMAARGIDVPMLTHVINYDLPTDAEHYVHRAGRCGRAGRPGIVVNMVLPDTKFVLSKFTGKLGLTISDAEVKDAKLWAIKRTVAETLE